MVYKGNDVWKLTAGTGNDGVRKTGFVNAALFIAGGNGIRIFRTCSPSIYEIGKLLLLVVPVRLLQNNPKVETTAVFTTILTRNGFSFNFRFPFQTNCLCNDFRVLSVLSLFWE